MFLIDPEKAHNITVALLGIALSIPGGKWLFRKFYHVEHPALRRKIWGLDFPNPVGLAAGG